MGGGREKRTENIPVGPLVELASDLDLDTDTQQYNDRL
jgi:hypothetical protein